MPELPEVYTISQDLRENIVGFTIRKVQISKDYKLPYNIQTDLNKLIDRKIQNVSNIAKNIVLKIDEYTYLVFHLAMTGRILLREPSSKTDNWVKVVLELQKNNKIKLLRFCDMRQFGKVMLLNRKELDNLLDKYGLMPLKNDISTENFLRALRSKKTNIKNVLLDQKILSGLGNIYATDALFLAKINPKTPTQDITPESAEKLLKSIREILNEGIKNRGSTLPDQMYVDIFGKPGSQQNHFKIYLKNNCDVCNTKVEFIKINGRGTYFCPTCQPLIISKNRKSQKIPEGQKKLL